MRRTLIVLTVLLLALTAGCDVAARREIAAERQAAAAGPPPPTRIADGCQVQGRAPRVGIVTINLQSLFFNQINAGAQLVAQRAGAEVQIVNGNDDATTQANAVDNLVANRFDAVIVDAVDTEGIEPALRRAAAAGVRVVAVDSTVDDPAVAVQVGIANLDGGRQLAEALLGVSGGQGEIGVVGALNSTIQLERQQGFVDRAVAGGMTLGTVVDGRNVQEQAQTAAENLLTGNPTLPYAYATGEPALIGLAAAVAGQGRASSIKVVGWDLSTQAMDGLRAGWVVGVVQQNTFAFGHESMNAAIDLVCGRPVARDVPVPVQIVTPQNAGQYLYYLERS